jgi:hypothetical protein
LYFSAQSSPSASESSVSSSFPLAHVTGILAHGTITQPMSAILMELHTAVVFPAHIAETAVIAI